MNDRSAYFLKQARCLEAAADRISERIWQSAPVSLTPVFEKIRGLRKQRSKEKSYAKQLRAQFNNFRLGLLEQVTGARLLENNNDLGEEVERILVQYLERRFSNGVRILRGGHIYDYQGNRSAQIDIIVTPADSLAFCPAETGAGKFNVMIDQVIAAISVTSRLTPIKLRERWNELQKIPVFAEKDKSHPSLAKDAWPLCYIVGAESDELGKLEAEWEQLTTSATMRHNPQMLVLLDSGYIVGRKASWPSSRCCRGPDSMLNTGTGPFAGLGLAWLETQIAGRNCILTGRSPDWIERMSKQLSDLELREAVPPTLDIHQLRFGFSNSPIHGNLKWGNTGLRPHNQLHLWTVTAGGSTLTDPTRPVTDDRFHGRFQFEPRWFKQDAVCTKGDFCALEEWTDPLDPKLHLRKITVINARTGAEIRSQLPHPLAKCDELKNLDLPVE